MGEFNDMLRRVKLDKIIGYLMYGTEDFEIENKETFEDRIEDAFDKIFESLEKTCPFISRENEELQERIYVLEKENKTLQDMNDSLSNLIH